MSKWYSKSKQNRFLFSVHKDQPITKETIYPPSQKPSQIPTTKYTKVATATPTKSPITESLNNNIDLQLMSWNLPDVTSNLMLKECQGDCDHDDECEHD